MKRKSFLSSLVPLAVSFSAAAEMSAAAEKQHTIPPFLERGDTIGITSPAGYISHEDITPAVDEMIRRGFKVKVGNTIGRRDHTFGGTDAERVADLQGMLNDKNIGAIMCARGGYGALRILDGLDFTTFKKFPKWIIGFSDITFIHAHLDACVKVASLHSKMCNSFPGKLSEAEPVQIESIETIFKALQGEQLVYTSQSSSYNTLGNASGLLVGGNLKSLESIAGSKSSPCTDGKILFIEDTGEYLYSIDRMMLNLKRSGKLDKLAGLVVGGFKVKVDEDDDDFGKTLQEVVLEKITGFNYPVCFNFPVGHQKYNVALQCGVKHYLSVSGNGARLSNYEV